jgi:hypothetical protein
MNKTLALFLIGGICIVGCSQAKHGQDQKAGTDRQTEKDGTAQQPVPEAKYKGKPVSFWIEQLRDRDVSSRKEAAMALKEIGPDAKAAIQALNEALKAKNRPLRIAAAKALVSIDPDGAEPAQMQQSMDKLQTLALAVDEYAQNHDSKLPPYAVRSKQEPYEPLLSWRVLLLPYLDRQELYRQFHLDEAWDSPHNQSLLAKIPDAYAPPTGKKTATPHSTYYQVFLGEIDQVPFARIGPPTNFMAIADSAGTSNTFFVVEAEKPVVWTQPEDIDYASDKPVPRLGGLFKDVFHACFFDGHVEAVPKNTDEKLMRIRITGRDPSKAPRKSPFDGPPKK